jgi:hypothetical protein
MNLVLFDCHKSRANLLPLTFTRPVADIRIGILTIRQKWEKALTVSSSTLTEEYLSKRFLPYHDAAPALYINGSVLPNEKLIDAVQKLGALQSLTSNGHLLAFKTEKHHLNFENFEGIAKGFTSIPYSEPILYIEKLHDIFLLNGEALKADFTFLTKGRKSQNLSDTCKLIGPADKLFIEEGAMVEASVLNTATGPIYIGKDAEVMESCAIRGPFALCEHAVVKMSAKIYGATTLGPYCKAGGELNNVS